LGKRLLLPGVDVVAAAFEDVDAAVGNHACGGIGV
jgi:hypothetical protein